MIVIKNNNGEIVFYVSPSIIECIMYNFMEDSTTIFIKSNRDELKVRGNCLDDIANQMTNLVFFESYNTKVATKPSNVEFAGATRWRDRPKDTRWYIHLVHGHSIDIDEKSVMKLLKDIEMLALQKEIEKAIT